MAQAIYRRQYRGNSVRLTRKSIGSLASMSPRQVMRCEETLKARGMLRVGPTEHAHVFRYQVLRVQGHLFDKGPMVDPVGKPVEYAVGNTGSAARLEGSSAGTLPDRRDRPPDLAYQSYIETEHLKTTNSKPGAEVRADSLFPVNFKELPKERRREIVRRRIERHLDETKAEEDRRKVEARDKRLGLDPRRAERDERVGANPLAERQASPASISMVIPAEFREALAAAAPAPPRSAMTEEEIAERKKVLREQAERLKAARR
jgi:hypothetical protein